MIADLLAEIKRLTDGAQAALDALRGGRNNLGRQTLIDLLEGGSA